MLKLRKKLIAALIAVTLLLTAAAQAAPTPTPAPTLPPFDQSVPPYDSAHPENLTADQLYAQAFILIDQDNGLVLMEKNADVRMNPASTTKIMTLLVALDYVDVNETVRVPAAAEDVPKDSSKVPISVGEEMSMRDLLYGMMLKSGNDAANAIAVLVAGSTENFVRMMNEKAAMLGCTGTHFSNVHGYTADDHYTTARDLAIITREAMQNSTFRAIVSSSQYTMGATNERKERTIENSNMMVVVGSDWRYSGATGVKTGTTSAAGQCLVSSATRNGVSLICVTLKCTTTFIDAKWQDATRLLDYGFSQYKTYTFDDLFNMLSMTMPVSGAAPDDPSGGVVKLNALLNRNAYYERTIYVDDLDGLLNEFRNNLTVEYTHEFVAPLEAGTIMGNLTFTPPDADSVVTAMLVCDRAVAAAPAPRGLSLGDRLPSWVSAVLLGLLALVCLIILLTVVSRIRKARRRALARKRARERARAKAARARALKRRQSQMNG